MYTQYIIYWKLRLGCVERLYNFTVGISGSYNYVSLAAALLGSDIHSIFQLSFLIFLVDSRAHAYEFCNETTNISDFTIIIYYPDFHHHKALANSKRVDLSKSVFIFMYINNSKLTNKIIQKSAYKCKDHLRTENNYNMIIKHWNRTTICQLIKNTTLKKKLVTHV